MRSGIGLLRDCLAAVMCLAVVSLICSSAPAQNLFVSITDYSSGVAVGKIYQFTPGGGRSLFASGLSNPEGLAFDSAGNLFVADVKAGSVYKFSPSGERNTFALGLAYPYALAFDGAGNLLVTDLSGAIYKFTPEGVRTTFASGLAHPSGLAFDGAGNLFVADGNTLIYKFTPTGTGTTFASGLYDAIGLAFDGRGNLFVADIGHEPVYEEWPTTLDAALYEFTPSGRRSTLASENDSHPVYPCALAFDSAGNLFVTEGGWAYAILKFTPGGQRSVFATGLPFVFLAFQPPGTAPTPPTPCDTNAPEITVPADIVTQKPPNLLRGHNLRLRKRVHQQGANVSFVVSATDPEDGPVGTIADPPSGSFFPLGTTTVSVRATDHCDNTASKTFTVTVTKQ